LEFVYDARHRRIAKVVKEWVGNGVTGGFTRVVRDRRYVYDGWNMIAELDHTTATGTGLAGCGVVRTQVWGEDLSGTMQGAGGVGGLLMVRHGGQSYVPLMDGNGNVMGLQGLGGAKDGQTVARYDYDAFGNRITNTAPELGEDVCPFGFSTKLTDGETGLVYYGYRYYSPEMGRWMSRDPIGEKGGVNLYGMLGNDAVDRTDYLGLHNQVATPFYVLSRNIHYDPATDGVGEWVLGNVLGINHVELNADSANDAGILVRTRSANLSMFKDVKFYDVFIELNPNRKLDDGTPCECAHIGNVSKCLMRNGSGCSGGNCQQDATAQLKQCCLVSKWYIDPYAYRPPPEAFDTGGIPLGR
jgi:RHS repeat-associated protein